MHMVELEGARNRCRKCKIFTKEFYCAAQAAEFRAIPWTAQECPYKKWVKYLIPEESEDIQAAQKTTKVEVSSAEMQIMTLLVQPGRVTTNVHAIDVLVAQYRADLRVLEANPTGCTNCARGKLLKQYITKLQPIIHLWKQP